MNIAAVFMIAGACTGLLLALLWLRISAASGWRSTRAFAWVALTAAGYCAADTALTVTLPEGAYYLSQQVSLAFGAAHAISWMYWFASMDQQRRLFPWERLLTGVAVVLLAACLVPGAIVRHQLNEHRVEWLGVTYHTPAPTAIGLAAFLFFIVTMWFVAIAAYRRWRSGWRATYPLFSVTLLSALAVLDTLTTAGMIGLPLMLDIGFLASITGFGFLYLGRFLQDAQRLEQLSTRLEHEVEERTRELSQAQNALARSEMLAAVGRLAAGVAHEINNPAAIVLGNLNYLSDEMRRSSMLPGDGADAVADATEATQRIAGIVKQLVEATQGLTGYDLTLADVAVGPVMSDAVSTVSVQERADIAVHAQRTDLVARADPQLLTKVLVQLITNAVEAVRDRADGQGEVRLSARESGGRVEVHVSDNGHGVSAEQRDRLFELFNTSRLARKGAGLGLAVAHGLTKAQGGSLRLVSTSSEGTTFAVLLPCGAPSRLTPAPGTAAARRATPWSWTALPSRDDATNATTRWHNA